MPFALICSPENAVTDSLRVLLGSDWTVFAEATAVGLLRLADEVPADVAFIDEYVRDAELVDVVHALRRTNADLTIVALTLSARSARVAAALPVGLDEVLTKPFDRDLVGLLVHRVRDRMRRLASGAEASASAVATGAPGDAGDAVFSAHALRALFRSGVSPVNAKDVAEHLLEGLCELFGLNRGVILWEDAPGSYPLLAVRGLRRDRLDAVAFHDRDGLAAWLRTHNQICQEQSPSGAALPLLARQEMRLLQAALAVPLGVGGQLRGVLALGNKLTGVPFNASELELIVSVAQYSAVMLGHAVAQTTLRRQQALFEGVIGSLASGVVMIDTDGRVRVLNAAAERVLDAPQAAALGQPVERLGSLVGDLLRRTLAGEAEYRRHRVENPATSEPLGVNTSQLRGPAGEVLGAIMVCTSLAGVETAPTGEERELETWNRFAMGMAHAIKNPLVAIKTFTQLYPDHHDDADFSENFYAVALREVERLDMLVDGLLQYASPEEPRRETCDLQAVLTSAVEGQGADTAGEVSVEVDGVNGPLMTVGDREQLRDAIGHMVTNAREAAGAHGRVWARARRVDGEAWRAVIEVEDTGPGFPADVGAEVFSPFFTTKDKGLGLGLALAERVARRHGGALNIGQSEKGGAKISLELPLAEPNES